MAVVISDELLSNVELTGTELLVELACFLYKTKKISAGKACKLANLNHLNFQQELAKREIDIHYSREDLDLDMSNLGIGLG
jgi:predicted HTH domain antitoxin